MGIKESFGLALKQARLARKLTQEDFSNVSSRTYISTLERAKFSPTIEKVDKIAKHIGIHPLTLITLSYLQSDREENIESLLATIETEIKKLY